MNHIDTMKLALEALAEWKEVFPDNWDAFDEQAITALREALAQQPAQQQEPAVWTATRLWNRKDTWTCPADIEKDLLDGCAPPSQQEPVAFSQFLSDVVTAAGLLAYGKTDKSLAARISEFAFRLRTSPQAQRTWVGLTPKEIDDLYCEHHDDYGYKLSATGYERAIEAKLREKNT